MDRPLLFSWLIKGNHPQKTRVRRGRVVEIPKEWQGKIPMWPGVLEERDSKKKSKRNERRRDKLKLRRETSCIVEEVSTD